MATMSSSISYGTTVVSWNVSLLYNNTHTLTTTTMPQTRTATSQGVTMVTDKTSTSSDVMMTTAAQSRPVFVHATAASAKTDIDEARMLENSLLMMLTSMQDREDENRTRVGVDRILSESALNKGRYVIVAAVLVGVLLSMLCVCRQREGGKGWCNSLPLPCGQREGAARGWYNSLLALRGRHKHGTKTLDYIYRPLQGDVRDDDYENTFVGVSVPLLQDVTKI